jgi:hypothetical protein
MSTDEAEYIITINPGPEQLTSHQLLPVKSVENARKTPDVEIRQRLAHKIYYHWRRTPQGKANDSGVPFTYAQLRIRKAPPPPASQQLDLS